MTLNDPLANVLSSMMNCVNLGKMQLKIKPVSRVIKEVLQVLQNHRYIGEFKEVKETRGKAIEINLIGGLNKCGVIKPRYAVRLESYAKFEKRYLPAKGFGILVISTPKGLMSHEEAKEKRLGGRLLAYCY